jgi:hypothetical protein
MRRYGHVSLCDGRTVRATVNPQKNQFRILSLFSGSLIFYHYIVIFLYNIDSVTRMINSTPAFGITGMPGSAKRPGAQWILH